ncbi:UNVERIFIED_ORG: hypothetical protein BDU10_3104 [Burkholderia sp. CF145]
MDITDLQGYLSPGDGYVQPDAAAPDVMDFLRRIMGPSQAQARAAAPSNQRAPGSGAPYAFGGSGGGVLSGNTPALDVARMPNTGGGATMRTHVAPGQASTVPAPYVFDPTARLTAINPVDQIGDAGSLTRAVTPSATYGFQDQAQPAPAQPPQSNLTDTIVGKTVEAARAAPGDSWRERIANLPQDPLFQVGLALMGAQSGRDIGEGVVRGFERAAAFQDAAHRRAAQSAIAGFDPSKFSNAQAAYSSLLHSGVDPQTAASVASTSFPGAELQAIAPGSSVIDKRTGKVILQTPEVQTGPAKAIADLTAARDRFAPGSAQFTMYDNAIKKLAPDAATANKPTEYQSKSAAFGARAQASDQILRQLENSDAYSVLGQATRQGLSSLPGVGGIAGGIANAIAGPQGQAADQAQRDFVNSILRAESGAVISQQEFDNARKQYFPQPGDGKDVIAQKQRNRQLAIQGLNNSAGRAAFTPDASAGGTPSQITPGQAGAIAELKRRGKI